MFLSLVPRGPLFPCRDSVKEFPFPLNPARICHQGLLFIRASSLFTQANATGAVLGVRPRLALLGSRLPMFGALFLESKRT